MEDRHRGIRTAAGRHLMLVVAGLRDRLQAHVILVPGSSTTYGVEPCIDLVVAPRDVRPVTALTSDTWFRMHEPRRFGREQLGRWVGRLQGPKLEELRRVRGLI